MKSFYFFSCLFLALFIASCGNTEEPEALEPLSYNILNHSSGFSVEYPSDWDTTNVMQGILFIAVENDSAIGSKKYRENIVVYRIPKSDIDLDSLFVIAQNELQFQYPDAAILSEKKGTCSSKHALLKCLAELNQIPNVDLFIGIYRMDKMNTPKIGKILCENHIDFIPKAHCYLKIDNIRIDFTFDDSDIKKIAKDIIQEIKIEPNQVVQFKVEYHKDFINEWLKDSDINFSEIWEIGEKCIKNLAL